MEDANLGDLDSIVPEGAMDDWGEQAQAAMEDADWGEQAANFTMQAEEQLGDQAAGLLNSTMEGQFDELAGEAWS